MQMQHHENCCENEGNHADDAGGSGADEGIAAVIGKVHADGGYAVDGAVGQNCGDAAAGF